MRDGRDRPGPTRRGGKIIRIDTARAAEPTPVTDPEGLLDLFRAWISRAPEERRAMPRHEAVQYQVWLGWWKAPQEFLAPKARLINISRGGALVFSDDPPPRRQAVWVGLGEFEPSDCVGALVLDVRTARRRECAVRLAFHAPCPHRFFEAAVCMLGKPSGRREPGAPDRGPFQGRVRPLGSPPPHPRPHRGGMSGIRLPPPSWKGAGYAPD